MVVGNRRSEIHKLALKLRKFAKDREWEKFHSPKNLSMALSVEVSELLEHLQWKTEEQSWNLSPATIDKIRDELGDVLIYLTRLSDQLGIDLVAAALAKLKKNTVKYPPAKVRGKALKYSEYSD